MRAISLDNYIDAMVEHLSDELKERRKQLVESRKGNTIVVYTMHKMNENNLKMLPEI
jgi:hypothetical protein